MANNKTFETVKQHFIAEDYQATQVGSQPILNLRFDGSFDDRDEEWKGQVIVQETGFFKKIVLFSFIPFLISRDRQELVVELLNRINYAEDIGNFEMNYNTGQVRCKTSVEVMDIDINIEILYGVVTNNTNLMGKYIPMIDQVNKGELLPMDAIDDDDYDNYE